MKNPKVWVEDLTFVVQVLTEQHGEMTAQETSYAESREAMVKFGRLEEAVSLAAHQGQYHQMVHLTKEALDRAVRMLEAAKREAVAQEETKRHEP